MFTHTPISTVIFHLVDSFDQIGPTQDFQKLLAAVNVVVLIIPMDWRIRGWQLSQNSLLSSYWALYH